MKAPSKPAETSIREPVLVDFALQGGGSHGAFTWGVLDRLLQEPWLRIDGMSGTSAGAMNAAVLADGHSAGGAGGRARRSGELLASRRRGRFAQPLAARAHSTCCWAVGRWTIRPSISLWT